MPKSPVPILSKIFHAIKQIIQKKFSGELQLQRGDRQWSIFFRGGRIIYATDNYHRVRRWQRVVRQCEVQFVPGGVLASDLPLWEYVWLELGVGSGDLALETAQQVIEKSLWEVLVVAAGYPNTTLHWEGQAQGKDGALKFKNLHLPFKALEPLAKEVYKLHQRLRSLGIPIDYLDSAPMFHQANWAMKPEGSGMTTYLGLVPLLNGRRTMLDVMVTMRQPLAIVAHIMRHLTRKDAVEFRPLEDRPMTVLPPFAPKTKAASMAAATTTKYKTTADRVPLVACVDDSPQVCATMEAIVKRAGYRFISTQDSVKAVSLLLRHQPDLIFLDLIMPIVNGYEVCKQLRRVKRFKTLPIAILTGNDGAIDRVRAKVVGASDFIAKPIHPDKIQGLLQKYFAPRLGNGSAVNRSLPTPAVRRALEPSAFDLRSPLLPLDGEMAVG